MTKDNSIYAISRFIDSEAAIEPFLAGGLIERAIGDVAYGVDGAVAQHIANIALWDAKGDTKPERPIYMLDPDTGLLMTFGRRVDGNLSRSGLFAEIVSLDQSGKPIHGVDTVNPLSSSRVIPVAIGENDFGFAPSHLKIRQEDPEDLITPPNIEIATLQDMLACKPIDTDEPLADFLRRNANARQKTIDDAETAERRRYRGTVQSWDRNTNPNVQLVISDRDVSTLLEVSRKLGIFPVHLTIEQMLDQRRRANTYNPASELDIRSGYIPGTNEVKGSFIPAFITYDYPHSMTWDPETRQQIMVDAIPKGKNKTYRAELARGTVRGLIDSNPVFAHIANFGANDSIDGASEEDLKYDRIVNKKRHGEYEQIIRPYDQGSVDAYEKWLRKVYLDFALTQYFRGLNQL